MQRVGEIRKVVDALEMLDSGLLTQNSNGVKGRLSLDVRMICGRIDMSHVAIRGHSFGGSTAIVACGLDKRLKCCIAEDAWWQPIERVIYLFGELHVKYTGKIWLWNCEICFVLNSMLVFSFCLVSYQSRPQYRDKVWDDEALWMTGTDLLKSCDYSPTSTGWLERCLWF